MITSDQLGAYLAGALGPGERARLEDALATDADALRQLMDQERTDMALRMMLGDRPGRERLKESILEVTAGATFQQVKSGVMEAVAHAPRLTFLDWLSGVRAVLAGGVAVAACVALALWLWPRPETAPAAFAQLSDVRNEVAVVRAGTELAAKNGGALQPGDTVRVGDGAAATMVYPDATRVEFGAGAQATFGDERRGKRIELTAGRLNARVNKQPDGKPFVINTPHAVVTVAGTVFSLAVTPGQTRLDVTEGLVRVARAGDDQTLAVAAGEFVEVAPGMKLAVAALEMAARDAACWPFSAESPWNHSIGSEAVYADIASPALDLGAGATINKRGEGRPVFAAGPGDPVRRIFKRDRVEPFATLRIPPEAVPDDSPWAFLNLIDEEHRFAYEMNGARRREDGDIEASQCFRVDLRGAGVPPKQMGVNVSGIPSLAGTIRKDELAGGIRHALTCIVLQAVLNRNGPNGHAFVWPAGVVPTDPKWTRMLSATGNLHLGTLLAIPSSVNIAAIGVGDSGPAFEIARALQDYGVYISGAFEGKLFPRDEKKPHIGFWIEPIATEELPKNIDAQLALIIRCLKVVANNTPTSVGGGGVPRRPLAPNFMEGAP